MNFVVEVVAENMHNEKTHCQLFSYAQTGVCPMNDQLLQHSFEQLLKDLKSFVSEEVTRQLRNQAKIMEQESWIKNSRVSDSGAQVPAAPAATEEVPMFHTLPRDTEVTPEENTLPIDAPVAEEQSFAQPSQRSKNMGWQVLERIKARKAN